MSALTVVFNHLTAYLWFFVYFAFGEPAILDVLSDEQLAVINNIITQGELLFGDSFVIEPRPVLIIGTSVFICGAVIGLVRKLIK